MFYDYRKGRKTMRKNPLIKKSWAIGTILLFLGTCVIPTIAQEKKPLTTVEGPTPIIKYPALTSIEIDPGDLELLNQPLNPEMSYNIKCNIGYSAAIPDFLLRSPFKALKNLFLFGTLIPFPQKIHLSVQEAPSWASIYFATPEIYISQISNIPVYAEASLIISPHSNAPATVQAISLSAKAPQNHRIKYADFSISLTFAIQWVPNIVITADQSIIVTPPNMTTDVPINVTNIGNGDILMNTTTPDIEGWFIASDPQYCAIPVGATKKVTIHILPPEGFHGFQPIQLSFTPSHNAQVAPSIPFELLAHYP
jgi:hypothetical protein